MIVVPCQQGTEEWKGVRRGIPTASSFDKIFTAGGKPSDQSELYRWKLLGAWMTGQDDDEYSSYAMALGNMREPEARDWYQLETRTRVDLVGFVYLDDRRLVGCSPDGWVGADGAIEIKCPGYGPQIGALLSGEVPTKHTPQIQGQMWITGREWTDFVSYHPGLPGRRIRVDRDDAYITRLRTEVLRFVDRMLEDRKTLAERYEVAAGVTV